MMQTSLHILVLVVIACFYVTDCRHSSSTDFTNDDNRHASNEGNITGKLSEKQFHQDETEAPTDSDERQTKMKIIRASFKILAILFLTGTAVCLIQYKITKRKRNNANRQEPTEEHDYHGRQGRMESGMMVQMLLLPNGSQIIHTFREVPLDGQLSTAPPGDNAWRGVALQPPSYRPPRKYTDVPPPSYSSLNGSINSDGSDFEEKEPELPPNYSLCEEQAFDDCPRTIHGESCECVNMTEDGIS
ncbi:uncharacterized protein LOC144448718 [Glandiceps talaboti]